MKIANSLINLVMPARCAVCDVPGSNICAMCQLVLSPKPKPFIRETLQGLSALGYDDSVSKLLVGYKEKRQASLCEFIASSLNGLIQTISFSKSDYYVVPVPSRPENFAKRGFHPSLRIAQQLSKVSGVAVLNCLRFQRPVLDQVGLDFRARRLNLANSMAVNQTVSGKLCCLVDDVVTSGASLLEARRALSAAGAHVISTVTLSEREG